MWRQQEACRKKGGRREYRYAMASEKEGSAEEKGRKRRRCGKRRETMVVIWDKHDESIIVEKTT